MIVTTRPSNKATFFALIMIAIAQPALAAAQSDQDRTLQKLVLTPQYQANLVTLFTRLPPDVFQRCSALISKGSNVTVVQPVTFASDGIPVSGVWKQSFPVSGCGNDTTINFFFTAQANEQILSTTAAPGDTHAGLTLQRDAARYAIVAVRTKTPGCDNLHLRTTRFDGRFTNESVAGVAKSRAKASGWRESWIFFACGQTVDVPMSFIPDATGTAIVAAPATVTPG